MVAYAPIANVLVSAKPTEKKIGYQSKGVQKLNTDLAPVNKILCPQILIQKLNLSTRFSSLFAQLFMSRESLTYKT